MGRVVLEVKNVSKKLGKKIVLKNVSFQVNSKDIIGIAGPNGAGKTTLLKIITGLQRASKGEVFINDFNITKNHRKAIVKVGALIESPDLYNHLTGYQNLKINARLYNTVNEEQLLNLIKLVGLENDINKTVSKYSLGMKQRLGICVALVNDPDLLILDEPTNGLDPSGIKELRELLKSLSKKRNTAIVIASHNLKELDSLCTRALLIKNGSIVENITMSKSNNSLESMYFNRMGEKVC